MFDSTTLYDQSTFYKAFKRDLLSAQQELKRMNVLLSILVRMRRRSVRIIVNTHNPRSMTETTVTKPSML